jgi:hypothetical protein
MMVAMISAMLSTFIMSATTIMATASGNQYTSARGEQGEDSQYQE